MKAEGGSSRKSLCDSQLFGVVQLAGLLVPELAIVKGIRPVKFTHSTILLFSF